MNLWVRSQDKEKLLKVNDIAIEINMIYGYFDKNTEYEHLGSYKSKERALEVLDDIQNTIFLKNMYEQDKESVLKSWNDCDQEEMKILRKKIVVYEMPEE